MYVHMYSEDRVILESTLPGNPKIRVSGIFIRLMSKTETGHLLSLVGFFIRLAEEQKANKFFRF